MIDLNFTSYHTTIVTSLFNINREGIDGRKWEQYLEWFRITLSLNSPMVIFVEEDTYDFVKNCRGDKPTKIIVQKLEEVPYYRYNNKFSDIINSEIYKSKINDPSRIECRSSLYNVIQFSKFGWIEIASECNYFDTDLYLWLDAGISRFFGSNSIDVLREYPNIESIEKIGDLSTTLYLQVHMSYYPDLVYSNEIPWSYMLDNRSYVAGGILMASKKSISSIKKTIDSVLDDMINDHIINNEQIVLGYMIKKYPHLFKVFSCFAHIHSPYEILKQLQ